MTQPAPTAAPVGAGCPVCGGTCTRVPDVTHRADYPFLPGGIVTKNDETVTATGRLFDADGILRYRAGQEVPKAELKTLQERPQVTADQRPVDLEKAEPAAEDKTITTSSTKRGAGRETRRKK